jgi:cytochrome c biogenesis protein CcdA
MPAQSRPKVAFEDGLPTPRRARPCARRGDLQGAGPDAESAAASSRRRPYLIVGGLTLSFAVFTLFGSLILAGLRLPDDAIRWAGLALLVLVGLGLLVRPLGHLLERPFYRFPQRVSGSGRNGFVLGIALGAVFVPCAGPVLAAITVAGATGHIGLRTLGLTLGFAVGTAIPLLAFALAGRGMSQRLGAYRRHQGAFRAVSGAVMIVLAVALTFNLSDIVQRDIPNYTQAASSSLEKGASAATGSGGGGVSTSGPIPASTASASSRTSRPAWYKDYAAEGLEVVGVHTPEYAFEHVPTNVAAGVSRLGLTFPVALDNSYDTWNAYDNQSWPAAYLIDATGPIRHIPSGKATTPARSSSSASSSAPRTPGSPCRRRPTSPTPPLVTLTSRRKPTSAPSGSSTTTVAPPTRPASSRCPPPSARIPSAWAATGPSASSRSLRAMAP